MANRGKGAQPTDPRLWVQAAAWVLLCGAPLGLAGCSSDSSLNPVNWWHGLQGGAIAQQRPPPPGANEPYPNLASVPPKPTPPDAKQLAAITEGLVADRTHADYLAAASPVSDPSLPSASPGLFGQGTMPPPPPAAPPSVASSGAASSGAGQAPGTASASLPAASAQPQAAGPPNGEAPPPKSAPIRPVQSTPLAPPTSPAAPPQAGGVVPGATGNAAGPAASSTAPAASSAAPAAAMTQRVPAPAGPTTANGGGSAAPPGGPAGGPAAAANVPFAPPGAAVAPPPASAPPPPLPTTPPAPPSLAGPGQPAAPPGQTQLAANAPPVAPLPANATMIEFVTGSASPPSGAAAMLKGIAAKRGNGVIAITGYGDAASDDPAAQSAALSLGLSRAQAVANMLTGDGVPQADVRVGAEAAGRGASVRLVQ